jgi:hypothetical protein
LRGISLNVQETAPGMGGPASPLLNAATSGSLPGTAVQSNLTVLNAITPTQSGIDITGAAALSLGPPSPQFDPVINAGLMWEHQKIPEITNGESGTNLLSQGILTRNISREPAHECHYRHPQSLYNFELELHPDPTAAARVRSGGEPAVHPHRQK